MTEYGKRQHGGMGNGGGENGYLQDSRSCVAGGWHSRVWGEYGERQDKTAKLGLTSGH